MKKNRTKYKLTAVLLSMLIIIGMFTACSESAGKVGMYDENSTTADATDTPGTSESTEETTATVDPMTVIARTEEYSFIGCNSYSVASHTFGTDVAWATFQGTNNTRKIGLIDKNGKLLYVLDHECFKDTAAVITTPFVNGLSCAFMSRGAGMSTVSSPNFVIVNSEGEEVYACVDNSAYMCGITDDGNFIVLIHESGFSVDEWKFYVLGSDFILRETGIKCLDGGTFRQTEVFCQFEKITEGVYYNSAHTSILNLNNGSWFSISGMEYCGKVGEYAVISTMRYMPLSLLTTAASKAEFSELLHSESCISSSLYSTSVTADDYTASTLFGGCFYHTTSSGLPIDYVDMSGNVLLTFPVFPDGVRYRCAQDFSGGYAALLLMGVDEQGYVTIIDENGTVQYNPVLFDVARGFVSIEDTVSSCNGYVFAHVSNDYLIIDPNGNSVKLGADLSGLTSARKIHSSFYLSFSIDGDFIYWRTPGTTQIVSVDGKTTINKVVANYNKFGDLIYPGTETGANNGTGDITETTPSNKQEYQFPSSYSIEGKWKNVGEYTFGQVQAGAIIVFDGSRCNFYSPSDTYAFYEKQMAYKLDVTSLLGETLSFVVRIVDENNIHIYNGNNYLELTRVD